MPSVSTIPFEAHPFTPAIVEYEGEEIKMVFVIRVRDGMTRRLAEYTTSRMDVENERVPLRVWVDGPYGQPPDHGEFATVVLIAGECAVC